jgi:lipoprotein-anchoring transpeptidase ErfK/SrfK
MEPAKITADPALARLQILLDRAGASPGVIDGFDGDNLHKALIAFQMMNGLPPDGQLSLAVAAKLDAPGDVIGLYTITAQDVAAVGGPIPTDYADKAVMAYLGYESVIELLAERFHMDTGLLAALNTSSGFAAGESVNVAITGVNRQGAATWIEADKTLKQVRVYGTNGALLAAYPATIGSEDNPSPTGTYVVEHATPMPGYTYNPKINFQQGDNAEVLAIPPGPNGPVGSMWIALSKPSFGIHGTPEPSMIDKTGSHGCIRLTNWDAEELAAMIAPGVTVDFL